MNKTWIVAILMLFVSTVAFAGQMFVTSADVDNGGMKFHVDKYEIDRFEQNEIDQIEGSNGVMWVNPHYQIVYTNSSAGDPADDANSHTNPVPEPATVILLGTGLAGLAFWKSRR